jgi:hypothetical protein
MERNSARRASRAGALKPAATIAAQVNSETWKLQERHKKKGEFHEYYHNERWNTDLLQPNESCGTILDYRSHFR